MSFKFRLQRVLDLRIREEEEKATRLAEAQTEAHRIKQTKHALEAAHEKSMHSVAASAEKQATVGQLRNLRLIVDTLDEQIDQTYKQAKEAEKVVHERMQELNAAFRDRRVLDRLKERKQENWRSEEEHKDRSAMDEIALSRFARKNDGNMESDT